MRPIFLLPLLLTACTMPAEGQHPAGEEQKRLMTLAESMRASGDEDASMVMLHQAAKASTDNTEAHLALAKLYLKRNNPQAAAEIMEQALKLQPLNPSLRNQYGMALDRAGRHAEAQTEYRRALKLKPDSVVYSNNLAYSLIASGQPDEAITLLQPFTQTPETPATVKHNLALAYGIKGDDAQAQATLTGIATPEEIRQNLAAYAQYRANPNSLFGPVPEPVLLQDPEAPEPRVNFEDRVETP